MWNLNRLQVDNYQEHLDIAFPVAAPASLTGAEKAIREALADAGVMVSKSTVQREASRRPPSAYQPDRPMAPPPPMPPTIDGLNTEPQPAAAPSSHATKQSGKDIAAAYFAANNFNPLFRKDQR